MSDQTDYSSKNGQLTARTVNIRKRSVQKPTCVGNYRLGKKIGSGAYGTVYEAYQSQSGEKFAAKVVHFNDSNYQNVRNEVSICQQLAHPNIARVEEVVEADNKFYIFMEFCENGQLFEYVKSRGPMKEEQAAKIFIQLHSAVEYLHSKKIAHRDIKTENVLLDGNMNAKLIDFGFSKQYNTENCMMETFCGSPSYVSPQILKKQKYNGEKVDVWSLGITLYIMLEAAEPFFSASNADTRLRIVNYQWSAPCVSSPAAKFLYDKIFVPSAHRLTLAQMKDSEFFEKYTQQRRTKTERKSTHKTERTSTGDGLEIQLPEIPGKKGKDKYNSLKPATETAVKDYNFPNSAVFRTSINRFERRDRSADIKTERGPDFRIKMTPGKNLKKEPGHNLAFYKREIISSLNQY